jgi:hypothetical protein
MHLLAVPGSDLLAGVCLIAAILLCVRASVSLRKVRMMKSQTVQTSVPQADKGLATAMLLGLRTSHSLSTTTDDGHRGAGGGSGFDSALTFHCEVVFVVLADIELPRHRDIIFLHQDRGCRHAILDVAKEVFGPGSVFVRRADPRAKT